MNILSPVIPAQAGAQLARCLPLWVPTCVGMTIYCLDKS
jgi:hypothetical protein